MNCIHCFRETESKVKLSPCVPDTPFSQRSCSSLRNAIFHIRPRSRTPLRGSGESGSKNHFNHRDANVFILGCMMNRCSALIFLGMRHHFLSFSIHTGAVQLSEVSRKKYQSIETTDNCLNAYYAEREAINEDYSFLSVIRVLK